MSSRGGGNDEWDAGKRHREEVRAMVREEKLSRGCALCGYREHVDALEWDHIEGGGGHQWIRGCSYKKWKQVFSDPNVRVLCANCHRIKSQGERRAKARG